MADDAPARRRAPSRIGEIFKTVLRPSDISAFIATHYAGVPLTGAKPAPIPGARNSAVYRIGAYVFKEVLRREFIDDPEKYARRYRFLERLDRRYPISLPVPTRHGERFVLAHGRLYELHPLLRRTRPWRSTPGSHRNAGIELAAFHEAARRTPGRALVAGNDVYAGTLDQFDRELPRYRRESRRRRDRISVYLRSYLPQLEQASARLREIRPRLPRLTRAVIHRDLHPANLLISGRRLVLMDFDALTVHEQVLDVTFMMDRLVIDADHAGRNLTAPQLAAADEFIAAYCANGGQLSARDFAHGLVILGEEYLKRTSSILRKHYLLHSPQDLPNLQRQDLRRIQQYRQLLAARAGSLPLDLLGV